MFKTKTAKVLLLFLASAIVLTAGIAGVSAYEAHSLAVTVTVVQPEMPLCLVIIDEDTIDNDISTIMEAAASHGVTPDELVNDDHPTEVGNPWLLWNELQQGQQQYDVVLLPGGEVKDEGWFALPTNWPLEYEDDRGPPRNAQGQEYQSYEEFVVDFIAGTVPQQYLDDLPPIVIPLLKSLPLSKQLQVPEAGNLESYAVVPHCIPSATLQSRP